MPKTNYESVEAYIASQSEPVQRVLKQVRSAIRKAVPGADEVISYNMPTYKLRGNRLLFFAGWKQHYSIYPATERVIAAFKRDLVPYKVNKGTIRFPLSPTSIPRRKSQCSKLTTTHPNGKNYSISHRQTGEQESRS